MYPAKVFQEMQGSGRLVSRMAIALEGIRGNFLTNASNACAI